MTFGASFVSADSFCSRVGTKPPKGRSLLADVLSEPKGFGFDQLNETRERRQALTELLSAAILLEVR